MSSAGSSSAGVALAFEDYLDTIGEEADRLVDAAARGLGVAVPTCPGWRVGDLVGHLSGLFLRFAAGLSSEPSDPHQAEVPSGDGDQLVDFETAAVVLVRALGEAGPDAPFTSPSGRELTAAWLARRMALETAVHRVDVELARGRANPVERELAVDGIDELIEDRLRARLPDAPKASLGGSICLVCTDDPAAWVVEVERGRLRVRTGRAPADAALVGTASDVLLFVWNRRDPELMSVTGDLRVAKAWRSLPL